MPLTLVVDDNPIDRKLIQSLLQRMAGWQVCVAQDGLGAIQVLDEKEVDLVVTDLQMPNLDGLQLVRHIRSTRPALPVILVTAFGSEQISMQAMHDGAANFTHKSRMSVDLVPTVEHVWKLAQRIGDAGSHPPPKPGADLAFVVDNDYRQIPRLIESLCRYLPNWTQRDRLRISMALEEALTNAICHGNLELDTGLRDHGQDYLRSWLERKETTPFRERRVRVQARFSAESIRFHIEDDGPGFQPKDVPDPTDPVNLRKTGGRGLLLIRTFMDQVTFNPKGNEITMMKRRIE